MSMLRLFFTFVAISLLIAYHLFIVIYQLLLVLLNSPTAVSLLLPFIYFLFPTMRVVVPLLQRLYISYRFAFLIPFQAFSFLHRVFLAVAIYCFSIARQRLLMDCLLLGLKGAFLLYSRRRLAIFNTASSLNTVGRILSLSLANIVGQPYKLEL